MEHKLLIWAVASIVSAIYAVFLAKDLLKLLMRALREAPSIERTRDARSAIWVSIFKCSLVVLTIPMAASVIKNEYPVSASPELLDIVFEVVYSLVILAIYIVAFNVASNTEWELTQRGMLSREKSERVLNDENFLSGIVRNWWFCKNIVKVYSLVIVVAAAMLYKVIH